MAVADLGGLGPDEGTPIPYVWRPPSLLPRLLPWIGLLLLLLLPANRVGPAWLVGLPLVAVLAVGKLAGAAFSFLPAEGLDALLDPVAGLAFGLAAVWLLAGHLGRRHRFLTFLGMFGVLAGFGLLYVSRREWGEEWFYTFQTLILLATGALITATALSLAGRICRRRHHPIPVSMMVAVCLLGAWLIVPLAATVIGVTLSGHAPSPGEIAGIVAVLVMVACIHFVCLLPFLLLSFINPLFRQRLEDLLSLEPDPDLPPPLDPRLGEGDPAPAETGGSGASSAIQSV